MTFFLIAILAGVLTILAPCIFPLLPVVVGASETTSSSKKKISPRALRVISALAVSVILFTLLLKASTLLITIPESFWSWFSGGILVLLGVIMIAPDLWARFPGIQKIAQLSNRKLGEGYQKKSRTGDYIMGFALGPVFTTCSPTYLFIIATILPASFGIGLVYLFGFTLGLTVSLLAVAYFGQRLVDYFVKNNSQSERVKKVFGIVILLVGIMIITGYDKKFQTWVLDSGYGATILFEERLIRSVEIPVINN
jgi:cytochrome c-type biogenesis protein